MRTNIYIPGIISITGFVLIFCYIIVPAAIPVKKETVIKHTLPSENRSNQYSGYSLIDQVLPKKKIIHINLTGDDTEDEKKIIFIQSEARRIKYTYDTSSMIEVHLADEISYGRFVQLVNIMLKDAHKRYGLWKNNFYIFGEPPPDNTTADTTRPIMILDL